MPYCGRCGKWLEEGEICSCGAGDNTPGNYSGSDPVHMHGPADGAAYGPAGGAGYAFLEGAGFGSAGDTGLNPAGNAGFNPAGGAGYGPADSAGYGPAGSPGYGPAGAAGYGPAGGPGYGPAGGAGYGPAGGAAGTAASPVPPASGGRASRRAGGVNTGGGFGTSLRSLMDTVSSVWIRFKNRVGLGEPETNDVDYYERNLEIVPQCIDPDSGEIPVRQYDMAVLRTRPILSRAEGRLQVTNKRMIFRATGRSLMGRTTLQHEFAIDKISGIKFRKNHRFSFLNGLGVAIVILLGMYFGTGIIRHFYMWDMPRILIGFLTLLITALTFVPFFMLYKKFPLKLFLMSIGLGMLLVEQQFMRYSDSDFLRLIWCIPVFLVTLVVLFIAWIICWVPNLTIRIETGETIPAVEICRRSASIFGLFNRSDYTGFAEVLPWRDTELAVIELWAMISDLKTDGDKAAAKWKK